MINIDILFKQLNIIKGIGNKTLVALERLLNSNLIKDLLFHIPVSAIDRTKSPLLKNITQEEIVTICVTVLKHIPVMYKSKKIPYKIICSDGTDNLIITFFNFNKYLVDLFKIGEKLCISGKISIINNSKYISHPDYIDKSYNFNKIAILEPIYSLTYGISNKQIRKLIQNSLNLLPIIPEWQNESNISFNEAINLIHNPISDILKMEIAKKRLIYDEILANQLSLSLLRTNIKKKAGIILKSTGKITEKFLKSFNFNLTNSQKKVLNEIEQDLKSSFSMTRLLQGDVGSGKTIVAFLSVLIATENNYQAAFMAPTEVLAKQHFNNLVNLINKSDLKDKIKITLLTGSDKGKAKEKKIADIKTDNTDIIIGTHALIEDNIEFNNLAMVVIDEQHKFGVNQRLKLYNKNKLPINILIMTATPIPRTLAMVSFGDMDISVIDELPLNRKPIETSVLNINKLNELILSIKDKIEKGDLTKIYWICPLIEESEKSELSPVIERYEYLTNYFNDSVCLLHGKLKSNEKDKVINDFANKNSKYKILVSTTVIEVGIDIPEATLMIIENAENFGLSSLHQLRGRVGRGENKSKCILLHSNKLSLAAKERLKIMKLTNNGFEIAKKDLELRGAGDILGIKQSGLIDFKFASLEKDYDLFIKANNEAKYIIENDLKNNTERWQNLQLLLKLFGYNEKIIYS